MSGPGHTTVLEPETTDGETCGGGRWMVTIYNNDTNSVDEVIEVLMLATECDVEEAFTETWEAHTFGKAHVHFAVIEECKRVASIISSVGVKTNVTREWED